MSHVHSTISKRSFKHLTPTQRGQIQALLEQKSLKLKSPSNWESPAPPSIMKSNEVLQNKLIHTVKHTIATLPIRGS